MNHLNRIHSTAIALQGARTFKTELAGIAKTPQCEEFTKALADATVHGETPDMIANQVIKAMGGNEQLALALLEAAHEGALEEVSKAMAHTRTLANGKMVNVKAYEQSRTASMKATTNAHGATFRAMSTKTPEAHENAAAMHEHAAKQHEEAHGIHPMDVPEVGTEHARLKGQHQMAAEWHKSEADKIRGDQDYDKVKSEANTASRLSSHAGTSAQAEGAHAHAAALHEKAAKLKPGAGHEDSAGMHRAKSGSTKALSAAMDSPHKTKGRYDAQAATAEAQQATNNAISSGKPEDHAKAAEAHSAAADKHLTVNGEKESGPEGHHGKIAKTHMDLHEYHSKKAGKEQPVAKADGAAPAPTGGHDLAKQEGMDAMKVEGRPDEKSRKKTKEEEEAELSKSEKAEPGPEDGVKVTDYETNHAYSTKASVGAHNATANADAPESHAKAASAHHEAAEAHRDSAKYAPEAWQKQGHEQQADLHDHYAKNHDSKAKAGDMMGDTGVDQPRHTAQSISQMEEHPEYQGYGYLGHANRTPETDKALASAANDAGLDHHQLMAHVLSPSGRNMMKSHPADAAPGESEGHFKEWLKDPAQEKAYGIKAYAKHLKDGSEGSKKK